MAKSNGKGSPASYGVNKSLATAIPKQPANSHTDDAKNRKRITRGELKEELQSDPTKDYHYTRYNYFGELFVQNLPLWRLFTGRMMLTSDPIVSFSMNIRNAALMALEVEVEAKKPEVAEWVKKQWNKLWDYYRIPMVSAKEFGFSPLQIGWKKDEQGILNINGLKDFAPEDCRGKERSGNLIGMSVKGQPLYFPHALWLTFGAKYGNAYGNPILRRQYPAWYEKWMERGAKRLQQLRMIKDAYIGDIFWYPPDMLLEIPDGAGGTKALPWKDVLREIAEARTSGGALTLPRKFDDNGKELTGYQPPTAISGSTEIFNWVEYCDENILKGGDIPYEVVQASDTGSGFSGRSIPFLVLLSVCNGEATEVVQQTDERGLRPVASLNFSGDPEYTIKPKSLVESFSADISGSSLAGGSIGGPVGTQQQQGGQGVPQAVQQQYSEQHAELPLISKLSNRFGYKPATAPTMKGFSTTVHPKGHSITWNTASENWTHSTKEGKTTRGVGVNSLAHHLNGLHGIPSQHEESSPQKEPEPPHEFSCLLFNLPGDVAFEVRQLSEMIPSEDLADDGREMNPHITLKFGLHTDDTEEVRQAIQELRPVAVQIGKASVFEGKGDGDKPIYDVVKLEVESSALHDLNNIVSKRLECTDTHPTYQPHITIAYVKPGLGEYYAKRLNSLEGRTIAFDRVIFSNKRREWNPIKLLGEAQFSETNRSNNLLSQTLAQPIEGVCFSDFNEWYYSAQFAEDSIIKKLRDMIGRGLLAAKNRVKSVSQQIRDLDPLESLQTLSQVIEGKVRELGQLLGGDLFSDAYPSYTAGTVDVADRLPPNSAPQGVSTSGTPPIAPGSSLGALPNLTSPVIGPIPSNLAALLFPEMSDPEIHLPAIEAAVEALNNASVKVGANYIDTANKVKAGSFAVTGELTEKAVSDIRDQLSKTIAEGKPQKEFIEVVADRLEKEGSPLSTPHLENVFRTNTMSAYSKAQAEAISSPMVSDAFPYAAYSATADSRVRPEHWALESHGLNGTNIYRYDDPTFQKFRPPWSYQCRCRWTPQTVEQAARRGVEEAKEWMQRAKDVAKTQGGSFYQYLNQSAPSQGQHVQPPSFEPPPEFKKDQQFTEAQNKAKLEPETETGENPVESKITRTLVRHREANRAPLQLAENLPVLSGSGGSFTFGDMVNAALTGIGQSIGETIGKEMKAGMSQAFQEGFDKLSISISNHNPIQMAEHPQPIINVQNIVEAPIINNMIEPTIVPAPTVTLTPTIEVNVPKPAPQTIRITKRDKEGRAEELKKE